MIVFLSSFLLPPKKFFYLFLKLSVLLFNIHCGKILYTKFKFIIEIFYNTNLIKKISFKKYFLKCIINQMYFPILSFLLAYCKADVFYLALTYAIASESMSSLYVSLL
jgi:hypothetical protein